MNEKLPQKQIEKDLHPEKAEKKHELPLLEYVRALRKKLEHDRVHLREMPDFSGELSYPLPKVEFETLQRNARELQTRKRQILAQKLLGVTDVEDVIEDLRKLEVESQLRFFKETNTERRFILSENVTDQDGEVIERNRVVPKESWLRKIFDDMAAELLATAETEEDLDKLFVISMDGNGLKAINDLASHEAGTEYIARMTEALFILPKQLRNELESKGVDFVMPATGPGDELFLLVKSTKPIDKVTRENLLHKIQKHVESVDASDLLSFDDSTQAGQRTLKRYFGEDWETKKHLVPENFKMPVSLCGSTVSLREVLMQTQTPEAEKNHITLVTDGGYRAMEKLTGLAMQEADVAATAVKKIYKAGLVLSQDPKEQFLAQVFSRNEGERRLIAQIEDMNDKLQEASEVSEQAIAAFTMVKEKFIEYLSLSMYLESLARDLEKVSSDQEKTKILALQEQVSEMIADCLESIQEVSGGSVTLPESDIQAIAKT